jgi:hypothetical protein
MSKIHGSSKMLWIPYLGMVLAIVGLTVRAFIAPEYYSVFTTIGMIIYAGIVVFILRYIGLGDKKSIKVVEIMESISEQKKKQLNVMYTLFNVGLGLLVIRLVFV